MSKRNGKGIINSILLWFSTLTALIGLLLLVTGSSSTSESLPIVIVFGIIAVIMWCSRLFNKLDMAPEKKKQLKKWILILIVLIFFIALFGGLYLLNNWNSLPNSITKGNRITVKEINEFLEDGYSLDIGTTETVEIKVKPINMTTEDVLISSSNTDVLTIDDVATSKSGNYTIFTVTYTAAGEGAAEIIVTDCNNQITVKEPITVIKPPIVKSFGRWSEKFYVISNEESQEIKIPIEPVSLAISDFVVEQTDDSVVTVEIKEVVDGNLVLSVIPKSNGSTELTVYGSDKRTESEEIDITVVDPIMLTNVYVSATGDKYHYSSSCAGTADTVMTRYEALKRGKKACSKCAQ